MVPRTTFAIRLYGTALTIHPGWLLIMLAVAVATLAAFAPKSEHAGLIVWYGGGVALISGFFASMLLHEAGHARVAQWIGGRQGRVQLYPFGGTRTGFTDPGSPAQDAIVALGGPVASAGLGMLLGLVWLVLPAEFGVVRRDVAYLALANLALVLVNLLPGYPLDGGRIFRALVWYLHDDYMFGTRVAVVYAQLISVLTLFTGLVVFSTRSTHAIWGLWVIVLSLALNRSAREEMTRAFFIVAGSRLSAGETVQGMNPRVQADQSLDSALETLLSGAPSGPALVVEDGTVVGILTLDHLRNFRRAEWSRRTVRAAMVPVSDLPAVDQEVTIRDLLNWLVDADSDLLMVTDHGKIIGAIDRGLTMRRLLERARARRQIGHG